ncbi:hypothetical protein [Natrinema hispanicum]|uniref:Uncharacterized protein n=1 Tax=Natrinema hispanicum TaxID=392421 RepID=A0A1G6Z6H4_9EURY|nr:hypothetical protein [Natrinema hispanicum]SDD98210.1 hypothetical protein SAMN05192552_10894 [Natrinema hispanicum]SEU13115.1 hypothetical protein SAMN04488694_1574 [Natrinema hispanicum]
MDEETPVDGGTEKSDNERSTIKQQKPVKNESSTVKRRTILGTIGSVGVGAFGLSVVGSSRADTGNGRYVEIDYALKRETLGDPTTPLVTETKEVSRDWLESLRRGQKARQEAAFEKQPFVNEVTLRPPMHGGEGPRIRVGIAERPDGLTSQEAREQIPAEVDNVPVEVFETGTFELGCYEYDYGQYVPAGADMERAENNSYCTLGGALHKNGNTYFSTCQHVFAGEDEDPTDRMLYNQDQDDAIGDIIESYCTDDFVVAEPVNGHTPAGRLASSGGNLSDLTIVMQFTQDALQDMIAAEEELTKRGVRTCETSGVIEAANGYIGPVDVGCSDRPHQLKWGADDSFDDGDSGSIAYQQVGHDQVAVAGVCNGRDPNPFAAGKVFGTAAWHIEEDQGYTYI